MSRIRTNFITNRMANGAPTVSNGLVVSGVTTTTNLNVTSDVVVGGGLTVGGVLTYEDVTNVDSVGMITARTDITLGDSIIHLGNTNTKMRFPEDNNISFDTNGNERVRINSNGRLLIGSSSVVNVGGSSKSGYLQIEGTNGNSSSLSLINNQNSTQSPVIRFGKTRGTSTGSVTTVADGDILGRIEFSGADGTDLQNSTAAIDVEVNGTVAGNQIPTDIVFNTSATDGNSRNEKVRITSTGRIEQSNNDEDINMDSAANGQLKLDGNGYGAGFALNATALNIYHNSASRGIIFGTNETERVRISSSGYVNIGPAADARKPLDITGPDGRSGASPGNSDTALIIDNDGGNGAILEFLSDNNAYGRIFFTDTDTSNQGQIVYEHGNDAFQFSTAATERLRIASAGQIGLSGTNYGTAGQVLTSGGPSAAPSWSGGSTRVLEYFNVPCTGESVATSHGTRTTTSVSGVQNLTTSYVDLSGSQITYRPPTGTHTVVYKFIFLATRADADTIGHFRFYVGSNEIQYARHTIRGEDFQSRVVFEWPIRIDSANASNYNHGRLQTWNSDLLLKMRARDYSGTYDMKIHITDNWDGAGTDMFSMPTISITALGT